METFKKSELEAMRVGELKELAAKFDIDVDGLRKADIVEVLLKYCSEGGSSVEDVVDAEPEIIAEPEEEVSARLTEASQLEEAEEIVSEELPEVPESEEPGVSEPESIAQPEELDPEEPEETSAPIELSAQHSTITALTQLHTLFKNADKTCPIRQISGKVKILQAQSDWLKVEVFISGMGHVVGYIFR